MKVWFSYRKPPQTVFRYSKFMTQVNSSQLITKEEIREWNRILEGDEEKLWKYIKKIIKTRTVLRQESNWLNGKVGKILKQFKTKWYKDNVINSIENNMVHIVKRLRIGNSKLRRHCKRGNMKKCINCLEQKEETIHHYLLECNKFGTQRKEMMNSVNKYLREMGEDVSVKVLLGYYPDNYTTLKKNVYFNNMKGIVNKTIDYIMKTKRFEGQEG